MKKWFHIAKNAASTDSLTIDICDEIGMWGVTAKDFAAQLKAAGSVKNIVLNLDCPGGDCNDGFTIFDALKNSGANITVNITGLAASMASVIMLAGNTIRIAENGRVMIHRVTGMAAGNTDDLTAAANITKQFEDRIVALYTARTSQDEAAIRDLMKAELGTWFFGQEAVDAGFADSVITGAKAKAFQPKWASKFRMLPAALFDSTPPASPPRISMKNLIKLAALVGVTGIPDNATEEQITAALEAYKPKEKNVIIDFEDATVKAAFEKAVAAHTQPLTDKITAVETENKRLVALITNGAAGSAGAGSHIQNSKKEGEKTIHEQYNAITNSDERARFYSKHKKELIGE